MSPIDKVAMKAEAGAIKLTRQALAGGHAAEYGGLILSKNADGSLSSNEEYVFFNGKRVARRDVATGAVHYYFSDHLGSADTITDASGNVQKQSDYFPFGGEVVVAGSDTNTYKFTAKEREAESGLDNFGTRYDASTMGRFMSPDAFFNDSHVGDPQSWNEYAYVRNNPLRYVDPTGQKVKTSTKCTTDTGVTAGATQSTSNQPHTTCDVSDTEEVLAQNTTLTTTLSDKGLKFIAKDEGFKGKEYSDIYGNTTIGYGHLVKPGEDFSNGISKKDALKLLGADTKDAVSFVNRHLDLYVSQNKFDALVDTAFNSPRASGILINKVNNEEPLSGSTFRNTLPHGYNSPPGLLRRRDDEADLYLAGQY